MAECKLMKKECPSASLLHGYCTVDTCLENQRTE
jgi:hypothetical protein